MAGFYVRMMVWSRAKAMTAMGELQAVRPPVTASRKWSGNPSSAD
jgi:hypothetical protein